MRHSSNSNLGFSPCQMARFNELAESGILDERILVMVFEHLKWDIHTLCRTASVNCRLRALAKRLLWRGLCLHRAPRLVSSLTEGSSNSRITGGWQALAKLLFFCCGCGPTRHFHPGRPLPGHFVPAARFSKTSGRSFLARRCRGDMLFVSDPCEHQPGPGGARQDADVGVFRGVFRSFSRSTTRECLIGKRAEFQDGVRCPYCGARVWSMTEARLVPKRAAARRLGSSHDELEYFVCLNGHLHGACWLLHLSSDEDREVEDDVDFTDSDDDEDITEEG